MSDIKDLKKELFSTRKNGLKSIDNETEKKIADYCEGNKEF